MSALIKRLNAICWLWRKSKALERLRWGSSQTALLRSAEGLQCHATISPFPNCLAPKQTKADPSIVRLLQTELVAGRSDQYISLQKLNDKDHAGLAEGTVLPQDNLPKFFAKNGFEGADPKKMKKNGAGKGNWGNVGDEIVDEQFNLVNARRRSNSSGFTHHLHDFKTKFEFNEPEPVFEESIHGPRNPADEDENPLTKTETSSSESSSVDAQHRKSM
ncbi:hypothetical protein F4678DRAFT_458974 [Xylaria arbuscula]|nr:hypothetical protein F4678DRAFT_458974 [Xylaria arbuscula]